MRIAVTKVSLYGEHLLHNDLSFTGQLGVGYQHSVNKDSGLPNKWLTSAEYWVSVGQRRRSINQNQHGYYVI